MLLNCEQCCGFLTSLLVSVAGAMAESKMNFAPNNNTNVIYMDCTSDGIFFNTRAEKILSYTNLHHSRLEFSSHVILVVENEKTL